MTKSEWYGVGWAGVIVFIISIFWITALDSDMNALQQDINSANSWSSIGTTCIRAAFDGFTLGAFADEGLFTETNKASREEAGFRSQYHSICKRYAIASRLRLLSVFAVIGCFCIGTFFTNDKKQVNQ